MHYELSQLMYLLLVVSGLSVGLCGLMGKGFMGPLMGRHTTILRGFNLAVGVAAVVGLMRIGSQYAESGF